jgi:hypothetical protein
MLRHKFGKAVYQPGEKVIMKIWIENRGSLYLHLSDIVLRFDFGTYAFPTTIYKPIPPKRIEYLGVWSFTLPQVVESRSCSIDYVVHEHNSKGWVPRPHYKKPVILQIFPQPFYRVFLSRGIHPEDRQLGDPIAGMIREWGFYTITVGIEIADVPDHQVPFEVKRQILMSDGVIIIATRRTKDMVTNTWKTLEWIHDETGIAFGFDKPMIMLRDSQVNVGGLPSYLASSDRQIELPFNPSDLVRLRNGLSFIMPSFRMAIQNKSTEELAKTLGKLAVGGLTLIGIWSLAKEIGKVRPF